MPDPGSPPAHPQPASVLPAVGASLRARPPATALAFDFGLRRIGLATGNTITGAAAPLPAITSLASGPDWSAIGREVRAHQPDMLIVGVPYNADGTDSNMARAARAFAHELGERFRLPVEEVDEHSSSLEAQERLRADRASGQLGRRVRKEDIDSAAAAIILMRWLAGEGTEQARTKG
jgi:putative Holliday junction resolvase